MSIPDWAKILMPARIQSDGCKSVLGSGSARIFVATFEREVFPDTADFFGKTVFLAAGILLFMTYE